MYVFQVAIGGAPSGIPFTPATSRSWSRAMKYFWPEPGGITSVNSLTGPTGGYRLRAGTAMPPLLLDDEEAIAIAVGLRTATRASVTGIEETAVRALVKLEQILPTHLRRRVGALGSATIAPAVGGPTVDPQHLTLIAAACRDSERLRFGYRSR